VSGDPLFDPLSESVPITSAGNPAAGPNDVAIGWRISTATGINGSKGASVFALCGL